MASYGEINPRAPGGVVIPRLPPGPFSPETPGERDLGPIDVRIGRPALPPGPVSPGGPGGNPTPPPPAGGAPAPAPAAPAPAPAPAPPTGARPPGGQDPSTYGARSDAVWNQLEGMFLGTDKRASSEALGAVKSASAGQTEAAKQAAYSDAARRGVFRSAGAMNKSIRDIENAGVAAYTNAAAELKSKEFDDRVVALKGAQDWLDGLDRHETNVAQINMAQAQLDLEKQRMAASAAAAGRGAAEDGRELVFRGADGQDYVTTVGDFKMAGGLGLDPRSLAKPRAAAPPAAPTGMVEG